MDIQNKFKVFICYASENQDLTDDFVERLQNQNFDFSLLYDRTPHSGNFNERFERFARTCDLAILLVSPRFTRLDSYANKHEVPILMKRSNKKEVKVVGVILRDTNINEWNNKGEIYFFPIRNNELPNTRMIHSYSDTFNRKNAVYEQVDSRDKSTYHKKLREYLLEVLKT